MLPPFLLLLPLLVSASSVVDSDSLGGFHRLPASDAARLSSEMLHLLDLGPDLPPAASSIRGTHRQGAPALTEFMQDVYRELGGEEEEESAETGASPMGLSSSARRAGQLQARYNVSHWLQASLHEADFIASVPPDESLHLPPWQRAERLLFRFDHLRSGLSLISAELRIFRSHFAFAGESMTLILHRLTERDGALVAAERLVTRLAPGQTGWLELNVSSFARSWMVHPEENAGLRLQLLSEKGFQLPPDLLGFETAPHLALSPFVVASFLEGPQRPRRVRRSTDTWERSSRFKRLSWNQNSYVKRNCARRELKVDFSELKWDQWVIAPRVYSAFYCGGGCSMPLHTMSNTTNHSIVQTYLQSRSVEQQRYKQHSKRNRKKTVPPPCCVPIELQAMNMLYFDANMRVVLRSYKEMKVKSCGCH